MRTWWLRIAGWGLVLVGCADPAKETGTPPPPDSPFLHPETPGPFRAGNTSVFLQDDARTLSCAEGPRVLLTELWYPADAGGTENTVLDFFLGRWDEVVDAMGGDRDALTDLPTGSWRDAPLAADAPPMPVLVFSHGFLSTRFQNYTMAAWLASHGYLVVAPDHTCNAQVALTEDAVVVSTDTNPFTALDDRVADVVFLLDLLTDHPPSLVDGRIDIAKIGLWGHSYGGVTILETLKTETRPLAVMPMAAFGFPPMPDTLTASSLHVWGMQDAIVGTFEPWHDEVILQMPLPRYQLDFPDTGHFAFSDLCLFVPDMATQNGCGTNPTLDGLSTFTNPDHDALHAVLNAYATAFFGATMLGEPDLVAWLEENHFPDLMGYTAEAVAVQPAPYSL